MSIKDKTPLQRIEWFLEGGKFNEFWQKQNHEEIIAIYQKRTEKLESALTHALLKLQASDTFNTPIKTKEIFSQIANILDRMEPDKKIIRSWEI